MVELFMAAFLLTLPIYGLIWLGIRNERLKQERLLRDATNVIKFRRRG